MNPYYQYPNVIAPYLQPMLQVNTWGNFSHTPQYGGWLSPDPRNVTFPPASAAAFPPTSPQPLLTGLATNQQMLPCQFSQTNAAAAPQPRPHVTANQAMFPCQFQQTNVAPQLHLPSTVNQVQSSQMNSVSQPHPPVVANSASTASPESSLSGNHVHPSLDLGLRGNMANNNDIRRRNITDIEDLMDANLAGTKYSSECTLILTEGRAAMSLAVTGLSEIGRDTYGLHALKRRLINVCKISEDEAKSNIDVKNITRILGLRYHFTYQTNEELKTLRYGKVILMIDRDEDGSHMKGLIINLFYKFWPYLLRANNFLMQFISPAVKVWCPYDNCNERFFYTVEEYEDWLWKVGNSSSATRHYRSLESFTPQEIKKYFSNFLQHCVCFQYEDLEDDAALKLAFEKDHEKSRKDWISKTMRESFMHYEDLKEIRYKDFVNKELLFYSDLQNLRSFPSAIDGLTRSQRKVLHAYFKRHYEQEISVLRLMGSVFDVSAYKQSMDALSQTVINMAQDFVGTNNINIFTPVGQFGTRVYGGKDAGKSKYLYTKLNPIMKYIFSELDFPVLTYQKDNDLLIEPSHYLPIIPMILVNGSEGIGTGWKTKIPKYNPEDIIKNLFRMLDNLRPFTMVPYFKNFKGQIENFNDNSQFNSYGVISVLDSNRVRITELPIGVWTEAYKEKVLNPMLSKNILHYEEHHTDTSINFLVTLRDLKPNLDMKDLYSMFHLKTNEKSNFVAFDYRGLVRDYKGPIEILEEYFDVRLSKYESRKLFMEGKLKFHLNKLEDLHKEVRYSDGNMIKCKLQDERYDFIYDIKRIQEKEINALEKDIINTREKLEQLQQKSPNDMWREELVVLCSKLGIILPNSCEVKAENLNDVDCISAMKNLRL